ncbi:hypothetical protein [Streptomyces sp. NPDC059850]|uniref:hypothetical protein n=1 Tax=Streptomyces sp. NPDC059850 TaxID=3346970 RepID=UPI0036613DEE
MTDATSRSQGAPQGEEEAVRADSAEARHDASPEKSGTYWDASSKGLVGGAMSFLAAGYRTPWQSALLHGIGFGLLSANHAKNSLKSFLDKDFEMAAAHGVNFVGTAVWTGGIVASSKALKIVGPALNCAANAASAEILRGQKEEDWPKGLIGAAEMLAFAVAGYTGSPMARAMAFGSAAAADFYDARSDKSSLMNGAAKVAWAAGAGGKNPLLETIGAAVAAGATTAQLLYIVYEKYAPKNPQQSDSGPILPLHSTASTAGPSPQASAVPANAFAAGTQYVPNGPAGRRHSAPDGSGLASRPDTGPARSRPRRNSR